MKWWQIDWGAFSSENGILTTEWIHLITWYPRVKRNCRWKSLTLFVKVGVIDSMSVLAISLELQLYPVARRLSRTAQRHRWSWIVLRPAGVTKVLAATGLYQPTERQSAPVTEARATWATCDGATHKCEEIIELFSIASSECDSRTVPILNEAISIARVGNQLTMSWIDDHVTQRPMFQRLVTRKAVYPYLGLSVRWHTGWHWPHTWQCYNTHWTGWQCLNAILITTDKLWEELI